MSSLFSTVFGCCLGSKEADKHEDRERELLLPQPPPGLGLPQPNPELPSSARSTLSDSERNSTLKQRLDDIVSKASHVMRNAPSQQGNYAYSITGPSSSTQTPSTSHPHGLKQSHSRAASRRSERSAQQSGAGPSRTTAPLLAGHREPSPSQKQQHNVHADAGSTGQEAIPGQAAHNSITTAHISHLTPRVRNSIPPADAVASSNNSGEESSNPQRHAHFSSNGLLEGEPERGRRLDGVRDVLQLQKHSPTSSASPTPRDIVRIGAGENHDPERAHSNGHNPGKFSLPDNDALILEYD